MTCSICGAEDAAAAAASGHAVCPSRKGRSVILLYGASIDKRFIMPAKLSAKYQISILKAVRTARHWKAGQEFAFIPKGEGVLLVPVPE